MHLVLDFGNTFQKCAVFNQGEIVELKKYQNISLSDLQEFVSDFLNIKSCILSSVIHTDPKIISYLTAEYFFINLSHQTPIPITNQYLNPVTLGKDRLAAAVAVSILAKGHTALSIDIGTAIKFDLVSSDKVYLGGSISPGLHLRFMALHNFTAKLPLLESNLVHDLIGNNTETSILSGVMNGAIAEVNGLIEQYKTQYYDLKIYLSGGESIYFEKYIKNDIFANSNLVLIGLNEILFFNERNYSL